MAHQDVFPPCFCYKIMYIMSMANKRTEQNDVNNEHDHGKNLKKANLCFFHKKGTI